MALSGIEVQAAGGIVRRTGPVGLWEILLVHRPGYDDWSLPKGKLDPGETLEEAALREVEEETGLVCRLLRPFGHTVYRDRKGRVKVVRYWLMKAVGGRFAPSTEVDQVRWLTVPEALGVLTYPRDRDLLHATPIDD
ncbi:MAG: NUDIX hydrolase [Candidatus Dormiibacterota bacterium]